MQEVPLPAIPTALTYVTLSHDVFNKHPARKEVWCGLSSGDLLQLFLDASTAHRGATLAAADSGKTAAITQVHPGFDSAQDGLDDIVVGREDGSIEIYHMDSRGRLMKVRCALHPFLCTPPPLRPPARSCTPPRVARYGPFLVHARHA